MLVASRFLFVLVTILMLGCGDDDPHALDGLAFESEEKVGVGLGPTGGISGNARLSFDGGKYSWQHSDLDCHGTYTTSDGNVEATTKIPCAFYGTIRGTYDEDSGRLTWAEGVRYRRK